MMLVIEKNCFFSFKNQKMSLDLRLKNCNFSYSRHAFKCVISVLGLGHVAQKTAFSVFQEMINEEFNSGLDS